LPLESAIQLRIIAALRAAGAYVTKFSAGDVGTPDLLVCYQGRFFGMEVKQPKNYPTKIQRHRLEQIALAGGVGVVVRSVDDALSALEQPPKGDSTTAPEEVYDSMPGSVPSHTRLDTT
jgi:hypothetical protein